MIDPFKVTEPTVISFSGGRTSAYMLWRVLQSNGGLPSEAIVCFANTGKEEQATLEFVRDCEANWGVQITWLEYRPTLSFTTVNFDTASKKGEPFEMIAEHRKMLPNTRARFCTAELKVRTMSRYLKSTGWTDWNNMIGIRADEPSRFFKMKPDYRGENPVMPLYLAGVTKQDVMKFWDEQSFNLNLPVINGETIGGNCDLCFLKSLPKIISLVKENPDRAIWWAKMEKRAEEWTSGDGNRFRNDRPQYSQIHNYLDKQMDMFDESIECFCGD